MFDIFISASKMIAGFISGLLISAGSVIGGFATQEQIVAPAEPAPHLESSGEEKPKESSFTKPQTTSGTQASEPKTALQIENVLIEVNGRDATVTWTTSAAAESRLIFDNGEGRVFESENGISTTHIIHAAGLEDSGEYDFKISATTPNKAQTDDYFDVIYANKSYTAYYDGVTKDGCYIVVVTDTAGREVADMNVRLQGSRIGASRVDLRPESVTTNSWGQVLYCENYIDMIRVRGTDLNVDLYP